jgi:hypothetical protein
MKKLFFGLLPAVLLAAVLVVTVSCKNGTTGDDEDTRASALCYLTIAK